MNCKLPPDFDFYKELNESILKSSNTNINSSKCLISNELLDPNYSVKLKCGHSFNYVPLFNDIYESKCHPSSYHTYHLKINELRCPYCRQKQDTILPYFPDMKIRRIRGVNYPVKYSMGDNKCNYVFKSGKHKGETCNVDCYREKCHLHYRASVPLDFSTINMTYDSLKKYTMPQLKSMAKHYKLRGFSKLTKNDLITCIINIYNGKGATDS